MKRINWDNVYALADRHGIPREKAEAFARAGLVAVNRLEQRFGGPKPMTTDDTAACPKCGGKLLGYRPGVGPRCRLCNHEWIDVFFESVPASTFNLDLSEVPESDVYDFKYDEVGQKVIVSMKGQAMTTDDLKKRFSYHAPKDDQTTEAYQKIREGAHQLAILINALAPEGREKSLAITKLEEVVMWSNAGIARDGLNRHGA